MSDPKPELNAMTDVIDQHLQAYAEPDRTRRSATVQRIWAADGRLIDPPLQATGTDAIVAQADMLLSQFPGHRFKRHTAVDAHNGHARYGWQLCNPAGAPVLEGVDIAQFDAAGRLQQVLGFFGPLTVLAAA